MKLPPFWAKPIHPHSQYPADSSKREFDVCYAVCRDPRYSVLRWTWTLINERLCIQRVKGKFTNKSLICAHASTEVQQESLQEIFYEQLVKAYGSFPEYNVVGDFSADVRTLRGGNIDSEQMSDVE